MTDRLQESNNARSEGSPLPPISAILVADQQRLKQILIKILTNAVNFSRLRHQG